MNFLASIFGKFLQGIYAIIPNFGVAIVLFTLLTRFILVPLYFKQIKSSRSMMKISPKMKEIQKKYAADKKTMQIKMTELYNEHGYNPFAGCLPSIIQLFLVLGMYRALRFPEQFVFLNPVELEAAASQAFLWIPNLNQPDFLSNIISTDILPFSNKLPGLMPIISSVFTYFSMAKMPAAPTPSGEEENNPMGGMMKTMKYVIPGLILFNGTLFRGSLMLYWTVGTMFALAQQMIVNKILDNSEEGK